MKFFRGTGSSSNRGVVPKAEMDFERACRELEDLVKSKKRRSESVQELSDGKDYNEEDIDQFDRKPSGRRRRDMDATFPGIQAMDDALFNEPDPIDHTILVSGRPARVRFPGARGDSELRSIQDQEYVEDADDEDGKLDGQDRIAARNRYGGDRLARRSMRRERGVADAYMVGKSLGYRTRPLSFELIKSKLHDAMADGNLDPKILLNFASAEPRLGIDLPAQMRALAMIAPEVRRRYGLPTDLGPWEVQGEIRRELSAP
jgi:hypothetical protein